MANFYQVFKNEPICQYAESYCEYDGDVEVVRCKDCIAHNLCKFEQSQGLNGFCSYGERKCNGK